MKKSKKLFVGIGALFIIGTIIIGYDISSKTSFPGSKKYLKESIAPSEEEKEVIEKDTTGANLEETNER
jgi:hypothetical protein